jgi:hypothetical protein
MKIIGFEEHWVLPAIAEANPNSPRKLFDTMRSGRFEDSDADGGWPTGILDLGEHRIAAMDAAGIDVQILSNVPGAEAVEVPLAVQLARQANEPWQLRSLNTPAGCVALPPCRWATPRLPQPNSIAPCATMVLLAR